jgi:hypothetical protein
MLTGIAVIVFSSLAAMWINDYTRIGHDALMDEIAD